MSFILSCDFWFCCGGANDEPADRYHHHPPPPSSQTQMVAVVQAPQVQQQQQPSYHQQMAPHPVAPPPPPPAPAAMGYVMPPPQTPPYWPHDHRPVPVMRQPVSACSSVSSDHAPSSPAPALPPVMTRVYSKPHPPVTPQAVPPRHVPSKSHEQSFLPSAETITPRAPVPSSMVHDPPLAQQQPAQAPWPARQPSKATAIQQAVPPNNKGVLILSKRYDETLVAAVAPTQTPPSRATSRMPSMKMKAYDEPPHQLPSKSYGTPGPVIMPTGSVNLNGSSHAATTSLPPLNDYNI